LFTHPSTSDIYTLSLHDALPILQLHRRARVDESAAGQRTAECVRAGHDNRALIDVDRTLERVRATKSQGTLALLRDAAAVRALRSEEHTSELQSQSNLVCRLLLE